MNQVFVLDTTHRPLTQCHPARARAMLKAGAAAVLRRFPFTIILKEEKPEAIVKAVTVKVDPGSKTTGLALVGPEGRVLFAAELTHRGAAIKKALETRQAYRRGRRSRNLRYRAPRFDNRVRAEGTLPPSLAHRVLTTMTWIERFRRFCNVAELAVERVKFDMQQMRNPEISGVEYQQGTLLGYTVREYLLEKFNRTCVYCQKIDVPLQVEHVVAKANGGSSAISNLTLACEPCNTQKGRQPVEVFLKRKPEVLAKLLRQLKSSLKDAAAVNATRNALFAACLKTGLPVEGGAGAQTKFNRTQRGYPKGHWIDAACVGERGATITLNPAHRPLLIKAYGHGARQRSKSDAFGFPGPAAPCTKKFAGFQTGDLVSADIPKGKYVGTHQGRIAIRHRPSFRLTTATTVLDVHPKYLTMIQHADGYAYR
jgi:5-methylcytosine-specific restriction endonuclease McrA